MTLGKKINNILEYIIALCIIINVNTVWNQVRLKKVNLIILAFLLFLSTIILFKNIIRNKNVLLKTSILVIVLTSAALIFVLLNNKNYINFIFHFVVILNLFVIHSIEEQCDKDEKETLMVKYSNVMVVLAMISLLFYFFTSVFSILKPTSEVTLEWGYSRTISSYFNLHYIIQQSYLGGIRIVRNTGIFTEAPMYSYCLVIALAVQEFFGTKKRRLKVSILLMAIITTMSATGIIMVCIIIALQYFKNNKKKKSKNLIKEYIKMVFIPVLLIILVSIGTLVIQNKINESSISGNYTSYSTRLDDFRAGYEAWKDYKVIGCGYENYPLVRGYMNSSMRENDMGGTSALMMMLPQGGIYLFLIFLIPLLSSIRYSLVKKKSEIMIMAAVITILYCVTAVNYCCIMIYFLAVGYSYFVNSK